MSVLYQKKVMSFSETSMWYEILQQNCQDIFVGEILGGRHGQRDEDSTWWVLTKMTY